jgi:hypothetical protein
MGEMQISTVERYEAVDFRKGSAYFEFQHGKGGWSKPMKIDYSGCTTTREVTEA